MLREDLSRNFGFLLTDVARLMRTIYDRRVKSLGLTRSQWWVLNHLFRGDGVTQTELADTLEIEKPTLGRLLDRLQAKGWVRREADAREAGPEQQRQREAHGARAAVARMQPQREPERGAPGHELERRRDHAGSSPRS